jgi:DNA-binding transcriptional regulator GbsR (MarR family)
MGQSTVKQFVPLSPQTIDFVEKIGSHYENVFNLPRIGCRILALLLVVPEPISMEHMENNLKVSHASISSNLRLLAAMGYIEKISYTGDRTTYFRFLPRSRVKALQERINHYQELKQVIDKAEKELAFPTEVRDHLEEMYAWANLAIRLNSAFIQEWEQHIRTMK